MSSAYPAGASIDEAAVVTAIAQLYRADVDRELALRRRLDVTSWWAISLSLTISGLVLVDQRVSHVTLPVLMFVDFGFAVLEARRLAHPSYWSAHRRMSLLERDGAMLGQLATGTRAALVSTFETPPRGLDWRTAMGWRLRRSHLAILGSVLAIWVTKLYLQAGAWSFSSMVTEAHIDDLPGIVVCGVVGIVYAGLCLLAWVAGDPHRSGIGEPAGSVDGVGCARRQ